MSQQGETNGFGLTARETLVAMATLALFGLMCMNVFIPGFWQSVWVAYKLPELKLVLMASPILPDERVAKLQHLISVLGTIDPAKISVESIAKIEQFDLLGANGVLLLCMAIVGWLNYRLHQYTKPMDVEDWLKELTKHSLFRYNRHLLKHNPSKATNSLIDGPYSMRLPMVDWAMRNGLLESIDEDPELEHTGKFRLKEDETRTLLLAQMGHRWVSVEALEGPQKWVLAIALAHGNEQQMLAIELAGDISYAEAGERNMFGKRKVSWSAVDKKASTIIERFKDTRELAKAVQSHAYVYGVIRAVWANATTYGKLPTTIITTVKLLDRRLYLLLNDIGIGSDLVKVKHGDFEWNIKTIGESSAEVYGLSTHIAAELEVGRRLSDPVMGHAIDGIKAKLSSRGLI